VDTQPEGAGPGEARLLSYSATHVPLGIGGDLYLELSVRTLGSRTGTALLVAVAKLGHLSLLPEIYLSIYLGLLC
jgi:hypothetical protein